MSVAPQGRPVFRGRGRFAALPLHAPFSVLRGGATPPHAPFPKTWPSLSINQQQSTSPSQDTPSPRPVICGSPLPSPRAHLPQLLPVSRCLFPFPNLANTRQLPPPLLTISAALSPRNIFFLCVFELIPIFFDNFCLTTGGGRVVYY